MHTLLIRLKFLLNVNPLGEKSTEEFQQHDGFVFDAEQHRLDSASDLDTESALLMQKNQGKSFRSGYTNRNIGYVVDTKKIPL